VNFKLPNFILEEVTGQKKYYNSMLQKYPFSEWEKNS
jgi:CYTH domain-containing protein